MASRIALAIEHRAGMQVDRLEHAPKGGERFLGKAAEHRHVRKPLGFHRLTAKALLAV